mgnify:CR=1 FL=1
MPIYEIHIKDHGEGAEDYEDQVRAANLKEAANKFWHNLPGWESKADWDEESLTPYINKLTDGNYA